MDSSSKKYVGFALLGSIIGFTLFSVALYFQWGNEWWDVLFYGPNATYSSLINENANLSIQNQNLSQQNQNLSGMNSNYYQQIQILKLNYIIVTGTITAPSPYAPNVITFQGMPVIVEFMVDNNNGVYSYTAILKNNINYNVSIVYSHSWGLFYSPDTKTYQTTFYLHSSELSYPESFKIT